MKDCAAKRKLKRGLLAFALAGGMSLAACGESERVDPVKEWVYVPEFVSIEDENVSYYDAQYFGDSLYYTSHKWNEETGESTENLCRYSLADRKLEEIELDWGDEKPQNYSLDKMAVAADGSICINTSSYTFDEATQSGSSSQGLAKFSAEGKLVFYQDVTERFKAETQSDYIYISGLAVDGKGRIYMAGEAGIMLFDGDGTYKGMVSTGGMDNNIRTIGADRDGKVYVCAYDYSGETVSCALTEIDFDSKSTGASYGNFPRGGGGGLTPGAEAGTFIVNDGSTMWEYGLETQASTALFDWLDSDINGSYVESVGVMEDGRILAVIMDWEARENSGIAYLTKTKGSEVAQKETILIGTMGSARELQAAAVLFNRGSDKYHVSIKSYMDNYAYSQDAYQDAITSLNNDLASKANCPDIIDLNGMNIRQLVSKGLLEDLGKYLDKSEALNRDDFVQNILNSYTYDGVLSCIPTSFELSTIVGKSSDVGDKMGWTLQEMIEYTQKHPGAALFDGIDKTEIMYYLLAYNEEAFIDWSKGKCSFDSDEFRSLLTFANSFPSEVSDDSRLTSTPTKIQRGEVLLDTMSLYDFDEIQMYYEIFGGDFTCKGLPTSDGSIGTALSASGLYGITSKASRKEGAGEFLESYLLQDSGRYSFGFPSRKSKLDEMAKKAVTIEYWTDENGQPVLDENGDPIEIGVGGSIGYQDGWSYTYRKATQEEVDLILQLIDNAKPISLGIMQVLDIIDEEAAGYFEGQKTVDEVVNVIQNRVQLYVDVNN